MITFWQYDILNNGQQALFWISTYISWYSQEGESTREMNSISLQTKNYLPLSLSMCWYLNDWNNNVHCSEIISMICKKAWFVYFAHLCRNSIKWVYGKVYNQSPTQLLRYHLILRYLTNISQLVSCGFGRWDRHIFSVQNLYSNFLVLSFRSFVWVSWYQRIL